MFLLIFKVFMKGSQIEHDSKENGVHLVLFNVNEAHYYNGFG